MSDGLSLLSVKDLETLAQLLGVQPKNLAYLIYKVKDTDRYTRFEIPKKSGGTRIITAPDIRLKKIQSKLAQALLEVYPERHCVHGFAKGKSIRSNARQHLHKRWVVNIDLKDFFPSIHFGRIKGFLQASPFHFGDKLSREIANLCCCNNTLPQGAPTSPIISNFVCWRLDNELFKLAKSCKCVYSRYADDITFSTNMKELPERIGRIEEDNLFLSTEITDIIKHNSFEINKEKVRFSRCNNHQEVTGITVNSHTTNVRRKYVRKVRAMLHACEHFGVEKAAAEHYSKYRTGKNPVNKVESFLSELEGKIGHIRYIKQIRGEDGKFYDIKNGVYDNLRKRFLKIYPESSLSATRIYLSDADKPIILGEGETDWKYMKKALDYFQRKGEFMDLDLSFREYGNKESVGYKKLLDFCDSTMEPFPNKVICIFDRDAQEVLNRHKGCTRHFKQWGNNVFSIVLPVLTGGPERFCIEQYFSDKEIMTEDENGRRLYLSSEFDKETGCHLKDPDIKYGKKSRNGSWSYLKKDYTVVLPDNVWDASGRNIALPKSSFASNIYNNCNGFNNFNFDNFRKLFEVVKMIMICDYEQQ